MKTQIKLKKELSDYLDMKPKAKTQTDTLELDMSHKIEANFEKQTKTYCNKNSGIAKWNKK